MIMTILRYPFYIGFGRYATAWEVQIQRLWAGIHRPRFWCASGLGFIRWAGNEHLDITRPTCIVTASVAWLALCLWFLNGLPFWFPLS